MTATEESNVPRHPIGVVADRTRLSQDVLRVWERRYAVVEPGRSDSGQRLYSDADIERLRLLSLATQTGRSISHVAKLTTSELARVVQEDEAARAIAAVRDRRADPAADLITPALERVVALDGPGLDALLRRSMLSTGIPTFVDTVAAPLLTRIGDEWHAGRLAPSQEHLASAVVHRVIAAGIHSIVPAPGAPNLVLATPSGERHEIGAVIAAAAAAAEGWRVTYLGADLPAGDIAEAALRTDARAVGLSIIYVADPDRVVAEITLLRSRLPASMPVFVGGAAAPSLPAMHGVRIVRDLGELRRALRRDAGV
jgi:DNA-binding transcriptional MerR regulator/methylmalonyl-CoA mutase cobalamin-binding subunit